MTARVYVAFRRAAPTGATRVQRLACWVIKARLVSRFCHGGIVVDGTLLHITAHGGYQKDLPGQWTPSKWDLVPAHGADADAVLARFEQARAPVLRGWRARVFKLLRGYDWVGLVVFAGITARCSWLRYCFELQLNLLRGDRSVDRVTPELVMLAAIDGHEGPDEC